MSLSPRLSSLGRAVAAGPLRRAVAAGPLRRAVAAGTALVLLAGTATACDSSPFAASVGSDTIKQTTLNAQLRAQTANKSFVAAIDQANQQQGQQGATVAGQGTGTYSTPYVASVLTTMIINAAVHQQAASSRRLPGPALLDAARSIEEAITGDVWLRFSPAFRDAQTRSDAEHYAIEPTTLSQPQLYQAYSAVQKYFFARVCTRLVTVAIAKSDGSLDKVASLNQAKSIEASYNLTRQDSALTQTFGGVSGGTVSCYTPAQLEAQGPAFFQRVLALAPGQADAPQTTAYGYNVLAVERRDMQPFGDAVQRALSVVVSANANQPDKVLIDLLSRSRVKVNQAYGAWDPKRFAVTPPSTLGANSSPTGSGGQ